MHYNKKRRVNHFVLFYLVNVFKEFYIIVQLLKIVTILVLFLLMFIYIQWLSATMVPTNCSWFLLCLCLALKSYIFNEICVKNKLRYNLTSFFR